MKSASFVPLRSAEYCHFYSRLGTHAARAFPPRRFLQELPVRVTVVYARADDLLVTFQGSEHGLDCCPPNTIISQQTQTRLLATNCIFLSHFADQNMRLESRVPIDLWHAECRVGPVRCMVVVLIILKCLAERRGAIKTSNPRNRRTPSCWHSGLRLAGAAECRVRGLY